MSNIEMLGKIAYIAEKDGRYGKEAFLFILAALEYALSNLPKRRHLTGQELSRGIAEYARVQFGYLSQTVLNAWGLKMTRDYGEIVYLLIHEKIMSKTEEDRIEDFFDVYDFNEEFAWEKAKPKKFPERL